MINKLSIQRMLLLPVIFTVLLTVIPKNTDIGFNEVKIKESSVEIDVNEINFPDDNFRKFIKNEFSNTLTANEIQDTTYLKVDGKNITNLRGIEYFTNLIRLDCYNNDLTTLDISDNKKLKVLNVNSNKLETLDISENTDLIELRCGYNNLINLYLNNNASLEIVYCENNNFSSLDVSDNIALQILMCDANNLSVLDIRNNTNLEILYCRRNELSALSIDNNTKLKEVYCDSNKLTYINLANNLVLHNLHCEDNQLTAIDVSKNIVLRDLYCSNNSLKNLDIKYNSTLITLSCIGNEISKLDVSNNKDLQYLYITKTLIKNLDLSNNKKLLSLDISENDFTSIDLSENRMLSFLNCSNNKLANINISKNTELLFLICDYNYLNKIDVSKNTKLENISCDFNQLISLNLKYNKNLNGKFMLGSQHNNIYSVDGTFDLATFDPSFDASKVSELNGATLNGSVLSNLVNGSVVSYKYDSNVQNRESKDKYMTVELTVIVDKETNTYNNFEYNDKDGVITIDKIFKLANVVSKDGKGNVIPNTSLKYNQQELNALNTAIKNNVAGKYNITFTTPGNKNFTVQITTKAYSEDKEVPKNPETSDISNSQLLLTVSMLSFASMLMLLAKKKRTKKI